ARAAPAGRGCGGRTLPVPPLTSPATCVLQRSSAVLRSGSSSEWLYTPAIPPREPDTWLTHNSMTSGLTPSSAIPVTAVRRKSCSRHGAIAALRGGSRAAVSITASRLRLARDQTLGGVVQVVVKTRSR